MTRAQQHGRQAWLAVAVAAACVAAPLTAVAAPASAPASAPVRADAAACTTNAALGRPATASSTEGPFGPAMAVDGDPGTRWSSAAADPQWIRVDLGSVQNLCRVELAWETAYGRDFRIEASDDGTTWRTLRTVTDGTGGSQGFDVAGAGRYVRVTGTERGTGYGYSLWELKVLTDDGGSTPGDPIPGGGDLGPNVHVFGPDTPTSQVQAAVDAVYDQQESDQFGDGRHQFLFEPGTYPVHVNAGFHTSIAGLGARPDDVNITASGPTPSGSRATPRRTSGVPSRTSPSRRPTATCGGRSRRRRPCAACTSRAT
jgi:hypothetical protein